MSFEVFERPRYRDEIDFLEAVIQERTGLQVGGLLGYGAMGSVFSLVDPKAPERPTGRVLKITESPDEVTVAKTLMDAKFDRPGFARVYDTFAVVKEGHPVYGDSVLCIVREEILPLKKVSLRGLAELDFSKFLRWRDQTSEAVYDNLVGIRQMVRGEVPPGGWCAVERMREKTDHLVFDAIHATKSLAAVGWSDRSLKILGKKGWPVDTKYVQYPFIELSEALLAAMTMGIYISDVYPGNLGIRPAFPGQLVLFDFSLVVERTPGGRIEEVFISGVDAYRM